MANEGVVQRQIWLALGKVSRLFRLNTGRAWLSNLGPKGVQRMQDGSVLIHAARSISIGLSYPNGDPVVGACDLPGWTTVEVTPAMVGKRIAVFTSIETKRSKGGKTSEDQTNWCTQVDAAGGIAGIASSPEQAQAIISGWASRNGANL